MDYVCTRCGIRLEDSDDEWCEWLVIEHHFVLGDRDEWVDDIDEAAA